MKWLVIYNTTNQVPLPLNSQNQRTICLGCMVISQTSKNESTILREREKWEKDLVLKRKMGFSGGNCQIFVFGEPRGFIPETDF